MDSQEKKKILLIDDDRNLLMTLSDFLKFEGYTVITADSGENGLKALEKVRPDLIILDMSMPGMGGVGFLKEISTSDGKPEHPVLVLTARANMAEFFANVDVDGFIAKPCDPNDLLMEVARIIFLTSGVAEDGKLDAKDKFKVLIGEDDDVTREKLVDAFAAANLLVDSVSKGPEVLEQAIVQRPDVIVVKRVLASMNGDAVAAMLKEMPNTKNIPIILYDESGDDIPSERYVKPGGAIRRFVKSSDPKAVVRAVSEILGE
jgi:CheY-like chemotaxis protein